jgi:hypothetical protein
MLRVKRKKCPILLDHLAGAPGRIKLLSIFGDLGVFMFMCTASSVPRSWDREPKISSFKVGRG